MHWIHLLGRIYPFVGISVAAVFFQLGTHFRRTANRAFVFCYGMVVFLGLTSLLWIFFRGDLHSDEWITLWLN